MTITYGLLNKTHPSIDLELDRDRRALYQGGAAVKARAHRFLHQRPDEPPQIYQARLAELTYRPYLPAILDQFANMLFKSKPIAVPTRDGRELHDFETAYYSGLKTNADRTGTNMDAVIKSTFIDAATTGLAWLLIHDPIDTTGLVAPINKADWEWRGLGNFGIERLEPEAVTDWDTDESGNLSLAIVHRKSAPRQAVSSDRSWIVETWHVYTQTDVETFRIQYNANHPPKPDTEVPSVDLRSHALGIVPLLCLQFNTSQHLAARLESSQIAHTRALNAESWSLSRSAYAQAVFYVNDPEAHVAPKMGPSVGMFLAKDEKATWLEPEGRHFDALDRRIRTEKDELFRVAAAMALGSENNAATVGRSAESKAVDAEASRVALRAFAEPVREFMGRLYQLLSSARGEDVRWRIDGLDDLDVVAYLQALKLLREGIDGPVHSPKARAALESRAIEALIPDATPEQKDEWRRETLASITAEPTDEEREVNQFKALHDVMAKPHRHQPAA
jgi:hypothetical protein